ncbi:MAG: methyltransferase domain-containing protein [Maribacter sp.]
MKLDKKYWEDKYSKNKLGWDIGYVSTPLKEYIDQLSNKKLKILIPGAGNGYEVMYLFERGFENVFVVDIALQPLKNIKSRIPVFPKNQLIQTNFFDLEEGDFDIILEQTFFCALDPKLREAYAIKMKSVLKDKGKLVGLLFDFPLTDQGPPFGGDINEYQKLFKQHFKLKTLERAYNSIEPRKGNELFFIFEK